MSDKDVARLIIEKSKELIKLAGVKIDELKKAQGFFACVRAASVILPEVVRAVEEASKNLSGVLPGTDKRDIAIALLLEYVKLPWWLPEPVVRGVLGRLIDVAVEALNSRLGKVWPAIPQEPPHS